MGHATFWFLNIIKNYLTTIFALERGTNPRDQRSIKAEQVKDLAILEGFGL